MHPAAPAPRSATPSHTNNGAAHQKTTICHATGSATNPYVEITISNRALKAHARHQDGRDIIPAPDGGCSSATSSAAQEGTTAGQTVAAATETQPQTQPQAQSAPTGESQVAGVTETNRPAASGAAPAAASSPVATTERSRDSGSLPFTGLDVALALLIAGALVLGGVALRRAASTRRTTA